MSRLLLCDDCRRDFAGSHVLHEGRYELLPASAEGPAEWVRVRRGLARPPTVEQKTILINGEPFPPTEDDLARGYACDHCNADIHPGRVGWCVTVWCPSQHLEPPAWEAEYVDDEAPA